MQLNENRLAKLRIKAEKVQKKRGFKSNQSIPTNIVQKKMEKIFEEESITE